MSVASGAEHGDSSKGFSAAAKERDYIAAALMTGHAKIGKPRGWRYRWWKLAYSLGWTKEPW